MAAVKIRQFSIVVLALSLAGAVASTHPAWRASAQTAQVQRPPAQPPLQPQPAAQEGLDRMGIVGYADHLSVQPGETIKVMGFQ